MGVKRLNKMMVVVLLFNKHCTASPSPWEYAFGDIKFDMSITEPKLVTEKKNIFVNKVDFKDFQNTTININNDRSSILYVLIYASTFNKITNSDENQDGGSIYLYHCSSVQLFVTSANSKITNNRQGIHCYIEYYSVTNDKTVINCSSIDQARNGGSAVCLKKGQQMMSSTNISNTFANKDSAYLFYYGSQNKENVIEYGNFIGNTAQNEYGIMSHERCNCKLQYSNINNNEITHGRSDTGIVAVFYTPRFNNVLEISNCNLVDNFPNNAYLFHCGKDQTIRFSNVYYNGNQISIYNNGNVPNSLKNIIKDTLPSLIKKELGIVESKPIPLSTVKMNPIQNRLFRLHRR